MSMNIPSVKYLKVKSAKRLKEGNNPRQVILIYAGAVALSALVVNAVTYLLEGQISQTSGLQSISTRSALSTTNTVLTIVQALLLMCLSLGYSAAMLRIARGQFASGNSLKAGFERIWLLLRTKLLQMVMLFAMTFALCLLVVNIYMMTSLSNRLTTAMLPLLTSETITTETIESMLVTVYQAMLPLLLIYVAVLIPLLWCFSCTYRLADYLMIDKPQLGAIGVMRESRKLMRGHKWLMFRTDISFWWYYLLQALVSCLVYLELILSIFGVSLPLSSVAYFFVVVLIYLAADFAVRYFFSNRVAVTYAMFYDCLCPKENENGAVLGNIFQM